MKMLKSNYRPDKYLELYEYEDFGLKHYLLIFSEFGIAKDLEFKTYKEAITSYRNINDSHFPD